MKYFIAFRQHGGDIEIDEFSVRERWIQQIRTLKKMDNSEDQVELICWWAEPVEES